jgi:HD-GYP domain-containing protein (c-di-GMP phosphodiesterase class II)
VTDQNPVVPQVPTPTTLPADVPGVKGPATVHYSQQQVQRARDVLARLYAFQRAVRFYPIEHPAVGESALQLEGSVKAFHDEGVEVQLAFFDGEILLGDVFLAEESMIFEKLVDRMELIGLGSLTLSPGMTTDEVFELGTILGADVEQVATAGGVVHMAENADMPHIHIGVVMSGEYSGIKISDEERAFLGFSSAVDLIEQVDESLQRGRPVDPLQVRGAVRSLVDGILTNRYSMLQLTGLKNYDKYTFYHSANVAILSIALGSAVSDNEEFLNVLGTGALLHDVGKLVVSRDLVNKPGQLTPEEWQAMRSHPIAGAQMVSLMPGIAKAVIVPILEHHMRWDGKGYPVRVPARRQHITSRIIAISDSYDAMTSRRSYSAARTQEEAMSLIMGDAGAAFDPVLARVFLGLMGAYPALSVVRLSSGEVAIVVRASEADPLKPLVRIISSPTGDLVPPVDVALQDRDDLSIESSIDPRLLNVAAEDYF